MKKISGCFLLGLSLFVGASEAREKFDPNHLFIKMKPGHELAKSAYIHSSRNIIGNIYLVKTGNISALSQEMRDLSAVEYVEKDYFREHQKNSEHQNSINSLEISALDMANFNDPMAHELWAFNAKTGLSLSEAYDILPLYAPKEIIVAVIDTGVDYKHEDLKDVMWKNPKEIPGNKIDDDKNGYIDDVHGINTIVRNDKGVATGEVRNSGRDSHYHGTHVAGTIAATQNNRLGIAGVANNVKLMAIRTVPDSGDEKDSNIVESLAYAAKNGAKIINCSFGKNLNEGGMVVRDTMNAIEKNGVLVVAAAGNNGRDIDRERVYPASFDSANMLVVAATDMYGRLSGFSNYGKISVDVAAPGEEILSTTPNNEYEAFRGTSMAAPHVSGVAAMILGYFPHLTPKNLKALIMSNVDKAPSLQGKISSEGRVNMKKILQAANKIDVIN